MPNHVTNIVSFEGTEEKVNEIVDFLNLEDGPDNQPFDFNKILPLTDMDDPRELWGTKWNSYDFVYGIYDVFTFDTAWSTPFPVIKKLSEMFPDVTIRVKFADEDIGSNCGWYNLKNGEELDSKIYTWIVGGENAENILYACEIKGYTPKEIDEYYEGLWTRTKRLDKLSNLDEN